MRCGVAHMGGHAARYARASPLAAPERGKNVILKRKATRREFLKTGGALACGISLGGCVMTPNKNEPADLILQNGKITTLDPGKPAASNVAIKGGQIVGVDNAESQRGP